MGEWVLHDDDEEDDQERRETKLLSGITFPVCVLQEAGQGRTGQGRAGQAECPLHTNGQEAKEENEQNKLRERRG